MKHTLAALVGLLVAAHPLGAQLPTATAARGTETLRVFVDNCPCSLDYLRTEITYVDYVRDRADADVHLLFGYQGTGAGGTAYTMFFIGLRRFAGTADTLVFNSEPNSTEDQERQGIVRYMKMGLMRYVARTPSAERIRISLAPAAAGAATQAPVNDPWDYWVFRTSLGGGGNGEKSRTRFSTSGSLSATRTTEMWKTRISMNGRYEQSKVTAYFKTEAGLDTSAIYRSYFRSASASGLHVRSLGSHFSTGLTTSASMSNFSNQDLFFRIAPAFEYSIFPYKESTRRLLTVNYSVGFNALDYKDETVYLKTSEQVFDHQLQVSYEVTQPWGSAFGSLSGQQYLHDIHLYAASAFGFASIRLYKGFNVNFNGSVSTIYNQISLQRVGVTEEDVLLQRRQLATPYRISGNISLSYTFGSIYNNIVNPRFGGGGGFFEF
jgi:hypothetical protein